MFTVISYDIADDRRRDRVLRFLRGYGTHVQQKRLRVRPLRSPVGRSDRGPARLDRTLGIDDVRCYLLDAAVVRRIAVLGIARVSRTPAYFLIGTRSLTPTPTSSATMRWRRVRALRLAKRAVGVNQPHLTASLQAERADASRGEATVGGVIANRYGRPITQSAA